MIIDAGFARWLREGALRTSAPDAAVAALWGELAGETEISTPLALLDDAVAEAGRQIEFLGGPLAIDEHLVDGLRVDLFGQPVTIRTDRLGYQAGVVVFVIGAAEEEETEQTRLTVVRKL